MAMSSNGNTIAISALYNDGNGINSGHVRIYTWDGTTWTQRGTDINGEAAYDNSGYSVAMSSDGNTIAIGAPYNGGNGVDSGHVRIYTWNGTTWTQRGTDINGEAGGKQVVRVGAHGGPHARCPDTADDGRSVITNAVPP